MMIDVLLQCLGVMSVLFGFIAVMTFSYSIVLNAVNGIRPRYRKKEREVVEE